MRQATNHQPARARHASAGARSVAVVLIAASLLTAGCWRSALLEVEGQVTLDGQPLADGTIEFTPAGGSGPTAGGLVTAGHYQVPVMPGEKVVRIQGFREIGREHYRGDPQSPLMAIRETVVPRQYNADTTLSASIDAQHRSFDFALQAH